MISFEDARKIVWETARKRTLETENIFLEEIPGRICAQELSAPLNIQPFDNAAMDGFAVRRSDLAEASEELPVTLQKTGIIAAGDPVPKQSLLTGSCVQIMTGAPVPPNAEAVVPVEQVKIQGDQIDFPHALKKKHISAGQEKILARGMFYYGRDKSCIRHIFCPWLPSE